MNIRQNVLIVDDEPRNQRIISEILEDLVDHRVASSGEEAFETLTGFEPDLILLDIMMPGIDGYEVCRRIRFNKKFALTKIILVSGRAMIEERLRGYEVGADDYMTKPFVAEELLAKIKVFLRLTSVERNLDLLNHSLEEKVQQLMQAEAKLFTSAKMSALGEMAGGIAHEINTPLGTIGMILGQVQELVAEHPIDVKAIQEVAEMGERTVSRIASIIQGLRSFSRDGSQDPFERVPIRQIVESILSFCQEKTKNGGIRLIVEPIPDTVCIPCRAVQISQVLLNLVNNACDAVSSIPERWVKISVQELREDILLSVTDSGSGIPESVQKKLFHPFFTTKGIGKGTGLGLSVSKGIADSHFGSLVLDPSCKNTRFVLRLPRKTVSTERIHGSKVP